MTDPLCQQYDVGLFDLDGVVYAGNEAIPHAAASIADATAAGMRSAYVTNNASRTPQEVAQKLAGVGVLAEISEIITSAQVAAQVLAAELAAGASVLVVGDRGLREAVLAAGMIVVESAAAEPAAVVQGHSPSTGWRELSEAIIAVRAGAFWVATNTDSTIPTDRGILAGNGAFVRVVGDVLGRQPDVVAGKPHRAMHVASVERSGARRPLVIGDRLDTDIEGATSAGCDSLYLMTGVSRPADVAAAPEKQRPTYVGSDLRALLAPGVGISAAADTGRSGRWDLGPTGIRAARLQAGTDDVAEFLAAYCAASWNGRPTQSGDDEARTMASHLGLCWR